MKFNEFIEQSDPRFGVPSVNSDDIKDVIGEIKNLPKNLKQANKEPIKVIAKGIDIDKLSNAIGNIKLAKGEKGEKGDKGEIGEKGDRGDDGEDGINGNDGIDAIDPIDYTPKFDEVVSAVKSIKTTPRPVVVPAPIVNVEKPDFSSLESKMDGVKSAVENINIVVPDNDNSEVVDAVKKVKKSIDGLMFPVPNYILPFKDAEGKATQALVNADGKLDGMATEAKQDAIITHLPLNEEVRLKVSTLPGMPEVCSGVLTTTVAAATDITGAGCVGGTGYIAVDVSRASNVMFSLQNTGTVNMAAGQFAIEASLDSTNGIDGTWIGIQAVRSNANTIVTNTGTLTANVGLGTGFGFEASVNANMWFRLRVTTNVTTGAAAKWTILRGAYATEPIPAVQSHAVTMTTTTVGGSASVVGFGQYRNVALSNTNVAVKTSAGRVYAIEVTNPDATTGAWLHFYNALIANVTVGTTVPVWSIYVPANTTRREYLTIPMTQATAITIAATTSAAHDVSTAPTTALIAFIGFI